MRTVFALRRWVWSHAVQSSLIVGALFALLTLASGGPMTTGLAILVVLGFIVGGGAFYAGLRVLPLPPERLPREDNR
jgi:hypothetical protein